jgi:alkanesulfonate monooxygenase SsuD/methylene tetrahydromethanopterin reductase-like flavin-dependent oxidoreductase (luciferase family)
MSCNPKPRQQPLPIIVGGHSRAAARRAGRLGEGFFPATGSALDLVPLFDEARRAAETAGRDPASLRFMTGCPGALGDEPLGAIEELAAAGVSRIAVPASAFTADPDELLGRFGERVIARLG